MARIGTAYVEISGDFSQIRRQLAALGREQGTLKIKSELDKPSMVRTEKAKDALADTEEFDVVPLVDRSSLAQVKAQKKTTATDERFNIYGAFDLASLAKVKAQKESIGGEEEVKVRFDVDVASLGKAIGAQIALKGATTATVRESGALADVFNRSSLSIGQMVLGAALLGAPIILDLAAALSAVAGSAAAATAGLGALAIGGAGVGAVGLGGILAIAGPAIGSLKDLMSAQEAANKSQATGAKSAGLATMASAQQIKAAHQQVADATRGVSTAEGQLELAQESAKFAQEALTQAREDATRQLQDMRRAAIEGETAEERARLSLTQANENLNQLLMSGTATALQLADADLSIVEARQNLRDVTIAGNRAQKDYQDAQRGGIDQMASVVSAQQSLDSAVRGVESAQQGVADAHRQVARALENLELQQRQANQATVAGGASMAALAQAQRKAGPEAVKFAETLKTLGRRWRNLTAEGKTDFFRLLNNGVDRLNRKLPLLAESANDSMRALRRGFNAFLDRATGPEFNHFVHVMTRTFAKSIGPISKAFGNIAKVLQRIAVAVAPDIVRMSKGFEDITQGWLDSTKNAKGLRETVHGLVKQAETWWDLVKSVGNVLGSLFTSGMDEGKSAIKGITDQLNEWADWIDKHPKKMHEFFANGLETAEELAKTIGGFFETFVDLGNALRPMVRGFIDLIQWLNSIKVLNISALTALISVILAVKTGQAIARVAEGFGALATKLSDVAGTIRGGKLRESFARLRGWFAGVTGAASRVANAVADWAGTMVAQIRVKGQKIRDAIGRVMRAGRTFVTSAATSAAEWAGSLVSNIRTAGLRKKLGDIFKRIAVRLGKIMAATVAAAVAVGEGIGGAAAGLGGRLERRLPGPMRAAGRIAGRAFGAAFVGAMVLLAKEGMERLSDELGLTSEVHGTENVVKAARKGAVNREQLLALLRFARDAGDKAAIGRIQKALGIVGGQRGGLVTEQGIVPQGFQTGGIVGGRRRRAGIRDTVPAMLEVGELVIPKKMVDETRKSAKKTALVLTDEIGEGYEKVSDDSKDFVKRHGRSMETLRKTASEQTKKFRKGTVDDFDKTEDSATERTKRMRANVVEGFAKMRSSSVEQSGKMKSGVGEDFRNLTGAVGDGLRKIAQMTNRALKALGVKKVNFNISTGDGGARRQTGGMVVPGSGSGDTVPVQAMVEPGEVLAVLNRKAAQKWMEWNEEFPRRQGGGIVDRTGVPHFAGGGWVGDSPAGLNPAVRSIAQWAMNRYGVVASDTVAPRANTSFHPSGGAVDLSASASVMLEAAKGLVRAFQPKLEELIHTPLGYSISGGQKVAAYAQADHYDHVHIAALGRAVAAVAKRIKEVILGGPEGPLKDIGQAALDKVRGAANAFISDKAPRGGDLPASIAGLGGAAAAQALRTVGPPRGGPSPYGGPTYTQDQIAQFWTLAGGTRGRAHVMSAVAMAESQGDPDVVNSIGATGLWQVRPAPIHPWISTREAQHPFLNAQAAVKILATEGLTTSSWAVWPDLVQRYLKQGGVVAPFVGSFAQGGEVRQDGLAMVHRGEKVLPKPDDGGRPGGIIRELKRALHEGGKELRQFLNKFHRRLDQMEKSRLRDFARRLSQWGGPAAKKLAAMVREELHERPRTQPRRPPRPSDGLLPQPQVRLGQLRRQRRNLRDELRETVERDDLNRKQMQRLVKSINAQIETNKELTQQNRELRRSIDEQNELYADVKSSTATAVRGLSKFVGSEIGHRQHQQTRNAGWGVDRRY